jgi:hypothetical protein
MVTLNDGWSKKLISKYVENYLMIENMNGGFGIFVSFAELKSISHLSLECK